MAAQAGKALILKADSNGSGNYQTIAGLRARSIALNAAPVDITHADSSNAWRELLEGGSVKSASISGAGIFTDADADTTMRQIFFQNRIRDWQVIVPDFGTIAGKFQITALEYAGDYDGEMTFQLALESAGALSFSAA